MKLESLSGQSYPLGATVTAGGVNFYAFSKSAYRAYGQMAPAHGYRFDGNKVLIDLYARAVVDDLYCREAAILSGENMARSLVLLIAQ